MPTLRSGNRRLIIGMLALAVWSSSATAQRLRTEVVSFPAGNTTQSGYASATVDVHSTLLPCSGDITISAERIRGSVRASDRYWFEGASVVASQPAPTAPQVRYAGEVLNGGVVIGRFAIQAGDARGLHGCYSGDNQQVAKLTDHYSGPPDLAQVQAFLDTLTIRTVVAAAPLTNAAVESAVRAERRRLAAEEARREQEAQRAAAAATETQARARQQSGDSGAERFADGDFWGTGSGQPGGNAGTGARPQQPVERDWVAESNELLARRQREHDESRAAGNAHIEQQIQGFQRSWYAGQQGRQARENIAELSQVRRSYDSVEELERDFQRRQSALQAEFRRLEESQSAVRQSEIARNFGDTDPAVGAVVGMVSGLIDRADREREARQARESLEVERQRQLRQMEARRRELEAQRVAMVRAMRVEMVAQFTDGNMPLSSDDIDVPVLHFFSYTVDSTKLGQPNPPLHVTDSFEVHRNGDGTWPFKHAVSADLRRVVPGDITLMGFYATRSLADEARRELLSLARLGEFQITEVAYSRPAPEHLPTGGIDFWSNTPAERTDGPVDFWRRSTEPPKSEGEP